MSTPEIVDYINEVIPDFLLVALGAEKGQAWIQKNREQLNSVVISHLGAVVNFVAGNVVRAPVKWQRFGLEWVWRIKQEPHLWQRYFFDGLAFLKMLVFKVFPLAIYDRWLKKSDDFKSPASVSTEKIDACCVVKLTGSMQYATLDVVKRSFANILQGEPVDVKLDCSGLVYIDAAFIGSLLLFQRYLNERGKQLFLQNVPKRIFRLLDLNNVLSRFQL